MDNSITRRKIITPANVQYIGIVCAIIYWIVDSLIDVYFFDINKSLYESVFYPSETQLWMRLFVLLMFMMFSVYIKRTLDKHEQMQAKMNDYEKRVELVVNDLRIEMHQRKEAIQKLEVLAVTDPLTQIYNRRKLHEVLLYEINRKYRYKSDLSIVMCDIDHFKKINDVYGHNAGDNVLKFITQVIKDNIRESDVFARWGGEEFVVLMPNTDITSAHMVANKLKEKVAGADFPDVGHVTASFGVALFNSDTDTADSFINRSDTALYQAKESGRNEVKIAV